MSRNKQVNTILKEHGLDFTIEKLPLIANSGGNVVETPYFGLFNSKTNECINTCKEGYTVSQNAEIIDLTLQGMEKFGSKLTVAKAASLNGGRRVVVQLAIEGNSKVGDDIIKKYVTLIDSNDGSTGLSVGIGDLTMSCLNQYFKFYKRGEAKFRHTATLEQKIQTIPYLIETALNESMKQIKIYKSFQSTEVSQRLANELVKNLLGYDREITSKSELAKLSSKSINFMNSLYNHIEKETAQKGMNLWGLHSGVTSFTTHEINKPKRLNGDIESMVGGNAYKYNMKSFEFAANEAGILVEV